MKIVIDIPEEIANWINEYSLFIKGFNGEKMGIIIDAITNGTPLEEGHGDLIDRNDLLDCSYKIDSRYCEYDEVVKIEDIKDARAIIEADKEEE